MQSNLNYFKIKSKENTILVQMDAGVKICIAILLSIAPFLCEKQMSIGVILIYIFIITVFSGIHMQVLFRNLISYTIMVLVPYLFGYLVSMFFAFLFSNAFFISDNSFKEIAFKFLQLFFIFHIGSLYFYTTPIESVMGMLNKVFSPLKLLGVPISEYINTVMCIVIELPKTITEFGNVLLQQVRLIVKNNSYSFKTNIKQISDVLVSLIVKSFQKIERIEKLIEEGDSNHLYSYRFKFSKNDAIAILSFVVLFTMLIVIEI